MIQRHLDDADVDIEAPRTLEELARIRAAVQVIQGRTYRVRTEPTPEAATILKACGVQLPPRVEDLTDERKAVERPGGTWCQTDTTFWLLKRLSDIRLVQFALSSLNSS